MKLIDADARVTVQSFDVEHEEYDHTEMSVEEALEFATDEGCPPFIDAAPVRRGKWHEKPPRYGYGKSHFSECSLCKALGRKSWKYCPGCGAKMDGGESDA